MGERAAWDIWLGGAAHDGTGMDGGPGGGVIHVGGLVGSLWGERIGGGGETLEDGSLSWGRSGDGQLLGRLLGLSGSGLLGGFFLFLFLLFLFASFQLFFLLFLLLLLHEGGEDVLLGLRVLNQLAHGSFKQNLIDGAVIHRLLGLHRLRRGLGLFLLLYRRLDHDLVLHDGGEVGEVALLRVIRD